MQYIDRLLILFNRRAAESEEMKRLLSSMLDDVITGITVVNQLSPILICRPLICCIKLIVICFQLLRQFHYD